MELVAALTGGRGHREKAKDKGLWPAVKAGARTNGALGLTPSIPQLLWQHRHEGGGGTQAVENAGFPRVPGSVSEQQTDKNPVSSS